MDAEDDDDYNNDRNADGVVFDPQSDLNDSGEEAGGGDDGVQIRTPTPTGARGHGHGGGGRGRGRGRGDGGRGLVRGRGRGRGRGEGGRPPGRSNYSNDELDLLLESVREILPISGREWEEVATRHASYFADSRRTGEQLKKKYNRLAKTKIPTGDPNCPPSVREAKTISRLIVEKTDGTTGDEYEIFSPDDDGDNGDEDDDEDDNGNNEGNEEEAAGEDRAGNVGDVEDAEDESRTAGRRRGPTPVTNRRKRNRDSDEGEPTFNDIMLMIANQQASEQRDRQEQRIAEREERERRYEELREDRRMQMDVLRAQMQQQTNLMTMMMMTMGGRGRAVNNVESELNNVVDTQLTTDVAVEEIIENHDNDQE